MVHVLHVAKKFEIQKPENSSNADEIFLKWNNYKYLGILKHQKVSTSTKKLPVGYILWIVNYTEEKCNKPHKQKHHG
jgi:hypothetical protein